MGGSRRGVRSAAAGEPVKAASASSAHAPLLLAVFLDLVGFGMVIPDVQTRLEAQGAAGWAIGLILSAYFLVQLVASPWWGRVSDRWGRKPVLITCGALSAASMLAYAFAQSPLLILLSRVLAGLAAANVVVAQAYVADTVEDDDERAAALGRISAALTAGLILGPALGGWLAHLGGNRLLGLVAATAAGLGALWIALAVPPANPATPSRRRSLWPDLSLLRAVPDLRPLFGLAAVAFFALACLEGTFGRLLRARWDYGPREFGLLFGYESLVVVLVQSLLLARLARRIHAPRLLSAAYLLQGAALAVTPSAPGLAVLFAFSTMYALGVGVANPTLSGLCSAATPEARQGEMFGLLQSARSAGFLVGPTLGSVLFDWRPDAPYLLAGAVLAAAGGLWFLMGEHHEHEHTHVDAQGRLTTHSHRHHHDGHHRHRHL